MRRAARFTEADIRRALKAAQKAKTPMAVEILPDGTIRIVPYESPAPRHPKACEDDGLTDSWADFRSPSADTVATPAIPQANYDRIQKWNAEIGYDPKTMSSADFWRLQSLASAKWKASTPGSRLQKLEKEALRQFQLYRVGELVDWNAIKGCGPATAERLELRGYIEIRQSGDRVIGYVLTEKGLSAALL